MIDIKVLLISVNLLSTSITSKEPPGIESVDLAFTRLKPFSSAMSRILFQT